MPGPESRSYQKVAVHLSFDCTIIIIIVSIRLTIDLSLSYIFHSLSKLKCATFYHGVYFIIWLTL